MNHEFRTRRVFVIGLVLLFGTVLGTGWLLNYTPASGDSSHAEIDKGPPVTVCFGQVDADPGVSRLHPGAHGKVLEVVTEGSDVKKGDVLLKLDDWLAECKLREAKADVAAARELLAQAERLPEQHRQKKETQQAAISAVKHQRQAAFQEYKVKEELYKDKNLSINIKIAYEETVKRWDAQVKVEEAKLEELKLFDAQAQVDINRARADVAAKEARHDQAAFALKECTLRAPADGTVLRVLVQVGEVLGPNPAVPALQFCPKGPKIVRAEVLQEWANRVARGQEVVIEDDTYAADTWKGRVQRVSDWFAEKRNKIFEPFMVNDVRTLECLIEVTSEGRPLRIGQRVRVKIKHGT